MDRPPRRAHDRNSPGQGEPAFLVLAVCRSVGRAVQVASGRALIGPRRDAESPNFAPRERLHPVRSSIHRSVVLCIAIVTSAGADAQCVNPIGAFPHQEDFEGAPVWTVGGTGSDWAWGTPAHPLINTAGGGANSWCVGGLTGTFYNLGQSSWLESPCFDMTALDHPWISFKIFWECERQYDGMNLQYSVNGGTTWDNVGAYNDPVDCLNDNWFNAANITNLSGASPKHGWSGRLGATSGSCQGGSGSNTWITAKHCMPVLANAPEVIFRFLFGAGTQCNNYDGIAIDDILIQEAPTTTAAFSYICNGNTIDFTDTSSGCPSTWGWSFGDPGSGSLNSTGAQNPSHTYPGPGSYLVSFSADGPCSDPSNTDMTIGILGSRSRAPIPHAQAYWAPRQQRSWAAMALKPSSGNRAERPATITRTDRRDLFRYRERTERLFGHGERDHQRGRSGRCGGHAGHGPLRRSIA
ncbi:MAG: PKD domain-containing protein [Flavobacteriales bacterium]|nr:PKD domain-containing protein [Flavobacteriales bacterium]